MTRGETLPAAAVKPADDVFVLQCILRVELAQGVELADDRRAEVARVLMARGYARVDLDRAAVELASDVALSSKLRYGGAFGAPDFRRVIEGDPEDREARPAKLMSYAEAEADARRRRVGLEDYRAVFVEGQDKPMWTPKWR